MGIFDGVSSLASESLGAAIGLGTKLPKYQDNSAQMELARMRAEQAKQARYDKDLQDEKKNWQIDYSSVHPVLRPEVEQAYAQLSKKVLEEVRKDPRYIYSPQYFELNENARKTFENAKADSQNIKEDQKMAVEHPDLVAVSNPELQDAIDKADYTKYRTLNHGGYGPHYNLHPNFNPMDAIDKVLKSSNPGVREGKVWSQNGANREITGKYRTYDENTVANNAMQFWNGNKAAQLAVPDPDLWKQMAIASAKEEGSRPFGIVANKIPKATEKEKSDIQLSYDELLNKGKIKENISETIPVVKITRDKNGKAVKAENAVSGTKIPASMALITKGTTIVASNGNIIDNGTNQYIKDNTQFEFKGGRIDLLQDAKTGVWKPFVVGIAIDVKPSTNKRTGLVHDVGSKTDVKVPLELVDGYVRGEKNQVDWAYEKADKLNGEQATQQVGSSKDNPIPMTPDMLNNKSFVKGKWYSRPDGSVQQYK